MGFLPLRRSIAAFEFGLRFTPCLSYVALTPRNMVDPLGDGRCAPAAASQRRVDSLLSDLNAGMPLDEAVRRHVVA